MENNQVQSASASRPRRRAESPRNHYYTYIVSILLTMLAFAAVLYGGLPKTFLISFLVLLGFVQVLFQLAYWMHMKERGHFFAIVGLSFGLIVTIFFIISMLYWTWW